MECEIEGVLFSNSSFSLLSSLKGPIISLQKEFLYFFSDFFDLGNGDFVDENSSVEFDELDGKS